MPERGEVWLANLNPRRGTEPGKTRPVLIVQAQALLAAGHPSTLIIPLTTNLIDDAEPLRIRVPAQSRLRRASDLLMDQLRALDNRRLGEGPLAHLDDEITARVSATLPTCSSTPVARSTIGAWSKERSRTSPMRSWPALPPRSARCWTSAERVILRGLSLDRPFKSPCRCSKPRHTSAEAMQRRYYERRCESR